jgi:hypothetical protein
VTEQEDTNTDRFSQRMERERRPEQPLNRFAAAEDQPDIDEDVAPKDVDEEEIESSGTALRPRPSPFARPTDEDDDDEEFDAEEREPERGAPPSASSRLRPTPFSAANRQADGEEDEEEGEEAESGRRSFSGAIRPSPFSSGGLRSNTEADERQDRSDRTSSSGQSRFQPRSPSTSPGGGRPSSFPGLKPVHKPGTSSSNGEDDDEEIEDEDDISYEDVEDSI